MTATLDQPKPNEGNLMNKHLAPVALSVGLLGIVGGVAAAHTFAPAPAKREVQVVQPASQVVTPSPTTTTPVVTATTAAPVVTATPKPVITTKAKTVQRVAPQMVQATSDPVTTTSAAPVQNPAGPPPVVPAKTGPLDGGNPPPTTK